MTIHPSFDADAYCRKAVDVRKRLMNPPVAKKALPGPLITRVVNLAHGLPEWRKGTGISFDAHVKAYRKSSRFAQGPNVYIRRRSIEMGFAETDALGDARFRPVTMLRRLLIWELNERFGIPVNAISKLLEMDDTGAYFAKNNPKPDPVDVCVCSILPMGLTYYEAIGQDYAAGKNIHAIADRYRLSHTSIHKIAHRMGWPLRKSDKGGRKAL